MSFIYSSKNASDPVSPLPGVLQPNSTELASDKLGIPSGLRKGDDTTSGAGGEAKSSGTFREKIDLLWRF
jgi:hypothetical protein